MERDHVEDTGYPGDEQAIYLLREASLLAACVFGGAKQVQLASQQCDPEDFQCRPAGLIFQFMLDEINSGRSVDGPRCLQVILGLEDAEGGELLKQVFFRNTINRPVNAEVYAFDVRQAAQRHSLIETAGEFVTDAREVSPSEAIGNFEDKLTTIRHQTSTATVKTIGEASFEAMDNLSRLDGGKRIVFPIAGVNHYIGGLFKGRVCTIAGRSGQGKTSLAMQVALAAARSKQRVLVFSYEMPADELATRLICTESGVSYQKYLNNAITETDYNKMQDARVLVSDLPMTIADDASLDVEQLKTQAMQSNAQQSVDLIVIDYIGIMPVSKKKQKDNRAEQIGHITKTIKQTARSIDASVVQLCQVNREGAKENWLKLAHLRDSSSIENDSDVVMFIQADGERRVLDIAKHRQGPKGEVEVMWQPQSTTFSELAVENHENYAEEFAEWS